MKNDKALPLWLRRLAWRNQGEIIKRFRSGEALTSDNNMFVSVERDFCLYGVLQDEEELYSCIEAVAEEERERQTDREREREIERKKERARENC